MSKFTVNVNHSKFLVLHVNEVLCTMNNQFLLFKSTVNRTPPNDLDKTAGLKKTFFIEGFSTPHPIPYRFLQRIMQDIAILWMCQLCNTGRCINKSSVHCCRTSAKPKQILLLLFVFKSAQKIYGKVLFKLVTPAYIYLGMLNFHETSYFSISMFVRATFHNSWYIYVRVVYIIIFRTLNHWILVYKTPFITYNMNVP